MMVGLPDRMPRIGVRSAPRIDARTTTKGMNAMKSLAIVSDDGEALHRIHPFCCGAGIDPWRGAHTDPRHAIRQPYHHIRTRPLATGNFRFESASPPFTPVHNLRRRA